jgi:hypothetical protein
MTPIRLEIKLPSGTVLTPGGLLQRMMDAHKRRDVRALAQIVKQMEGLPNSRPHPLSAGYTLLTELYAEKKETFSDAVGTALKLEALDAGPEYNEFVLSLLLELRKIAGADDRLTQTLKSRLGQQLRQPATQARLTRNSLAGKRDWFEVICGLFKENFLALQRDLAEALYSEEPEINDRVGMALSYLSIIRHERQRGLRSEVPPRAEPLAQFVVDHLPDCFKDKQGWDSLSFHLLLVNLYHFGFVDLLGQAMARGEPPPGDPAHEFFALSKLKAEGRIMDGFVEVMIPSWSALMDVAPRTISQGLHLLKVEFIDAALRLAGIDPAEISFSEANQQTFVEWVLHQPAASYPEIAREAARLRHQLLTALAKLCSNNRPFSSIFQPKDEIYWLPALDKRELTVCLNFIPTKGVLTQFIRIDGATLILEHPIKRDENGWPNGIESAARFQTKQPVPLYWELLALLTLAKSLELLKTQVAQFLLDKRWIEEVDQLGKMVSRRALNALELTNDAAFREMEKRLERHQPFKTIECREELERRLRLTSEILRQATWQAAEATYQLGRSDLLWPTVGAVEIISREVFSERLQLMCGCNLEQLTEQFGRGERLGLVVHIDDELKVMGFVQPGRKGEPPEISFPGVAKMDELLADGLTELVREALIKLFVEQKTLVPVKGGADPGSAYLIDPQAACPEAAAEPDSSTMAFLGHLYQRLQFSVWRQKGLVAARWFEWRDDWLFHPLEDQSAAAKASLAANPQRLARIQVPVDFSGTPMRLRVALKRGPDGQKGIYPWEPNLALRLEQQKLFGETKPLPQRWGLYVLTEFTRIRAANPKDVGKTFTDIYRMEIVDNLEEILSNEPGALGRQAEELIASGHFRVSQNLFARHKKRSRAELTRLLADGDIQIKRQFWQAYEVLYTYRRPQMVPITALLEQGFPLLPLK